MKSTKTELMTEITAPQPDPATGFQGFPKIFPGLQTGYFGCIDWLICHWGHLLSESSFYLLTYPGSPANKAFSKVISFGISTEGGPVTIKKQLSVDH